MNPISFKRHRFPPDLIRYAVWLYFRFTLSIGDVGELLAQRGIEVSREAIRCWASKFGPLIAANLRCRRSAPTGRWRLDEMVVRIRGWRMYLWRAVDDEGEVLDVLVQKRRNRHAALKLLRRLLKNQGVHAESIITDKLASYRAAAGGEMGACGLADLTCQFPRIHAQNQCAERILRGGPEGTRTPDLGFRKALLYPAELPGRTHEINDLAGMALCAVLPGADMGHKAQPSAIDRGQGMPRRRTSHKSQGASSRRDVPHD